MPGSLSSALAICVRFVAYTFVPAASLPDAHEVGPWVRLWQPQQGGHVGFAQGRVPGHVRAMPEAVVGWLMRHAATG